MIEKLTLLSKKLTDPKILLMIGSVGILLLLLPSLIPKSQESAVKTAENTVKTDEYREELEKNVKRIVEGITGDKNAVVVVTLESNVEYTYADSVKSDSSDQQSGENSQSSNSRSQTYVTVRSSDGGEEALLVTEIMPKVRGVAVICRYGDDQAVAEKIEYAVTAAFNITSKRVYIAGGVTNEKR